MRNKEDRMLELKRKFVDERKALLEKSCKELIAEGIKLLYVNISERSNIPLSTLERSPYKEIIKKYKSLHESQQIGEQDYYKLKEENKYLKLLINQLNKENKNLKIKLLENDII